MSWFKDPELFIDCVTGETRLWRLQRNYRTPITKNDFIFVSNVADYRSLIDGDNSFSWNKTDFDSLAAFLYRHYIAVNCQGLVLTITYPGNRSSRTYPDRSRIVYFLSHDVLNLPRYGLPVPTVPFRVVRYLEDGHPAPVESSTAEKELSAKLVARCSEQDGGTAGKQDLERRLRNLEARSCNHNHEKDDSKSIMNGRYRVETEKKDLEKKVFDLVAEGTTLKHELQRAKDNNNSVFNDWSREKVKNQDLAKRVSHSETRITVLKDEAVRQNHQRSTITNDLADGNMAAKQVLQKSVYDLVTKNASLHDDLQRAKDDKNAIVHDRDREKAKNRDLTKRVSDSEAENYVLKDEVGREKDQRSTVTRDLDGSMAATQALEKRVVDLVAKNADLQDDFQRAKDDKNAAVNAWNREKSKNQDLTKRVSDSEAENYMLKDEVVREKDQRSTITSDLDGNMAEKQILTKRVSDLEAQIFICHQELQRWKDDNNVLINDLDREKAEKQDLQERLIGYEAEISTLKDDLNREKDYKTGLEEMLASLEADKYQKNKLTDDTSIWIHEVSDLQEQLNREKTDRQALEKKVLYFSSKHEEYWGTGAEGDELSSADKEPWMSGHTVPTSWIPFALLVQTFSRETPLTLTKASGVAPEFREDNTTNVKVSHFYRGMMNGDLLYPIVVVDVEELIPNKEKAMFDPNVWGLFKNGGAYYAARKPYESEEVQVTHNTPSVQFTRNEASFSESSESNYST